MSALETGMQCSDQIRGYITSAIRELEETSLLLDDDIFSLVKTTNDKRKMLKKQKMINFKVRRHDDI